MTSDDDHSTSRLLVHHDERKVGLWQRARGRWSSQAYVDGVIPLAVGCELAGRRDL